MLGKQQYHQNVSETNLTKIIPASTTNIKLAGQFTNYCNSGTKTYVLNVFVTLVPVRRQVYKHVQLQQCLAAYVKPHMITL